MNDADRPRPRPTAPEIPDGGIPVGLPSVLDRPPAGKRVGHRRRAARRFVRTRRGKWTVVSIAVVLTLLAGLLFKGFLSSPAGPLDDAPPAAASDGLSSYAPTTGPSVTPSARPTGPATAEDIRKALQGRAGTLNNPLNALRSPGVHTVTVSVRSAGPVNSVGYLIPTSINTNFAYGTKKVSASSFGFSTKAVGPGYLALLFIQSGATGARVTCSVSIDGKVTSTDFTQGPYGRQICLG